MMEWCFWKTSYHWSSHPDCGKKDEPHIAVRVAYFKTLDWFCFNFRKYHASAVEVMQKIPPHERFFYQKVQDRYTKFTAWCVDGKHFEQVLAQLQLITDIELEFVISPSSEGLVVPEPFQPLNLTFYERGKC